MPTLKHFLGNATESKGRRFKWDHWKDHEWFEPLYRNDLVWVGVDNDGEACRFEADADDGDLWIEVIH